MSWSSIASLNVVHCRGFLGPFRQCRRTGWNDGRCVEQSGNYYPIQKMQDEVLRVIMDSRFWVVQFCTEDCFEVGV